MCGNERLCSMDRNRASWTRGKRCCEDKVWLCRKRKRQPKSGFGLGSVKTHSLAEVGKGPGCKIGACGSWMNQPAWWRRRGPGCVQELSGVGRAGGTGGTSMDGDGAEEGQKRRGRRRGAGGPVLQGEGCWLGRASALSLQRAGYVEQMELSYSY